MLPHSTTLLKSSSVQVGFEQLSTTAGRGAAQRHERKYRRFQGLCNRVDATGVIGSNRRTSRRGFVDVIATETKLLTRFVATARRLCYLRCAQKDRASD